VDHVLEIGGGAETLSQSIRTARLGGHIGLIGVLSGSTGAAVMLPAITRQLRIQGLLVGSNRHQTDLVRAVEALTADRSSIVRSGSS
jgi:threonine dehydrogenase-like Zn-dependent dehydrogenase